MVFVSFCFFFFVFLSWHHSDQISAGSEVSKVTICVQILQCHRPMITNGRYGAALAAKKPILGSLFCDLGNVSSQFRLLEDQDDEILLRSHKHLHNMQCILSLIAKMIKERWDLVWKVLNENHLMTFRLHPEESKLVRWVQVSHYWLCPLGQTHLQGLSSQCNQGGQNWKSLDFSFITHH